MKEDNVKFYLGEFASELYRAEAKHPVWPTDVIHASAILNEEAGELTKAALDFHKDNTLVNIRDEAVQVGAMALRFLIYLDQYERKK